MRYNFEESIVARYNEDASTEVNQSFEYMARVHHCLRDIHVNSVSSIKSTHSFHPLPPIERLHFSFKRTVLKLCFSLAKLSLTSDALHINLCHKIQSPSDANGK